MTLPVKPLTQRVELNSFYTDGERLAEVWVVNPLGYVTLKDCATGEEIGRGIDAFRRDWWLVRDAAGSTQEDERG